jgi:hypothetical protein
MPRILTTAVLAAHICIRNSVVMNCSEQELTGSAFVALFIFWFFEFGFGISSVVFPC